MTSDSSSPRGMRKEIRPASPTISPAQAIADAWKRESPENQEKWRKLDAEVKTRYNAPRKLNRKTKM
ncbi:hypothetical protein BDN70DRAFT_886980 [Pholiota conissans]|uniref:Uncharacterized protein n=1 Tax=Pholiota conissans TaxID=109636 RepID=A0A9P6CSU8_9AGAR|nr:hypothetical protein BDN70DRAFT_886980 [Pholiota conissans]